MEDKKLLLWVDDLRPVPTQYFKDYIVMIARSYYEAISYLGKYKFDIICLDHDLGDNLTGYDLCKYMTMKNIICSEYRIHTSNPVGRKNMTEWLYRYTDAVVEQIYL